MRSECNLHTLQSQAWPDPSYCTEEQLFIRDIQAGYCNNIRNTLHIKQFGSFSLMTYFNAFHLTRWRQINPNIEPIFQIKGTGDIALQWTHLDRFGKMHKLDEVHITLDDAQWTSINTPSLSIKNGFIAPFITALSQESIIQNTRYVTTTPAERSVRLGLVITHFKRHKQVLSAINRLASLMQESDYQSKISLKVIDNSQDLPFIEQTGVTIIPNKNLGGSGGFARGLLEYEQVGGYTHCLFMDDDASCSTESIKRTIAALEMSIDESTAIAGAMLREDKPALMHENGANFTGLCKPIHCGLNMATLADIAKTDHLPHIDYGGWWYFAFPISKVKNYPFPFFVRGDDVSFSLANKFHITTLNGVCSWQDSFEEKSSPLTNYLDTRSHLIHLLVGHINSERGTILNIIKTQVKRRTESMMYESAEAALMAIEDVLQGPQFWVDHMDMSERRQVISAMTKQEKMRELTDDELTFTSKRSAPRRISNRLAYHLTIKGLLLPNVLLRRRPALTKKSFIANRYELFRFPGVIYLSEKNQTGFFAKYDKFRFIKTLIQSTRAQHILIRDFKKLSEQYKIGYENLTSRKFWQDVYAI